MRILSVGSFNNLSNTCVHRNWALERIGEVDIINMYEKPVSFWFKVANRLFNYGFPISLPDLSHCNKSILKHVRDTHYDMIWIDKGWLVNKQTLVFIRKISPKTKIVSYSPDNMALRHNQSQNYLNSLPHYDCVFTNKSYILDEMRRLGARRIFFVNNSYEDTFHHPRKLAERDFELLGGDVGFVGMWEEERCKSILYLAENGIRVRIFGGGKWLDYKDKLPTLKIEDFGLFDEDYSKSLQAFKISLCFLRKINLDKQTTRTMEIPACGGFMLAERTDEHMMLFEEGKEAEYFSSDQELLAKCKHYLKFQEKRLEIVSAGIERCRSSGYSNSAAVKRMVNIVFSDN